jgi:hypothetical protein
LDNEDGKVTAITIFHAPHRKALHIETIPLNHNGFIGLDNFRSGDMLAAKRRLQTFPPAGEGDSYSRDQSGHKIVSLRGWVRKPAKADIDIIVRLIVGPLPAFGRKISDRSA